MRHWGPTGPEEQEEKSLSAGLQAHGTQNKLEPTRGGPRPADSAEGEGRLRSGQHPSAVGAAWVLTDQA